MIAGCLALSPGEDAGPVRTADKLLRIYLQDHHATSSAGVQRIRRLAAAEADGPDGPVLARIADEIAAERESQERVMRALGVDPSRAKEALAKVAERAGLLKLNGKVIGRSPLTSLVELEAMTIAVRGKLAGWTSLRAALHSDHVGGIDLGQLIAQSEEHVATFGELHRRRAAEVLTLTPTRVGDGAPPDLGAARRDQAPSVSGHPLAAGDRRLDGVDREAHRDEVGVGPEREADDRRRQLQQAAHAQRVRVRQRQRSGDHGRPAGSCTQGRSGSASAGRRR